MIHHELMGELRSLVAGRPQPAAFGRLCALADTQTLSAQAIDYVCAQLTHWPSEVERQIPAPWLDALIEGQPRPELAWANHARLSLHTDYSDRGASVAQALSSCPELHNVHTLRLALVRLRPDDLRAMLESPHLGGLRHVSWKNIGLDVDSAEVLATTPASQRLEVVDLSGNQMGDAQLAALTSGPYLMDGLRELSVNMNQIGPLGAAALAGCPQLRALTHLQLDNNHVHADGVRALAHSPHLASLERFHLGGSRMGTDGADALAHSPYLHKLTRLNLNACALGDEGLSVLAASSNLERVELLSLGSNGIGSQGARALAEASHMSRLRSLNLERNAIGDEGARALAQAVHLRDLDYLSLFGNAIGEEGARALAQSPYLSERIRHQWQ